jgi:hypothetical protein
MQNAGGMTGHLFPFLSAWVGGGGGGGGGLKGTTFCAVLVLLLAGRKLT